MGDRSHADAGVQRELGLPGRYEPLRHIAAGGMASVWCARDQALGRNVAIKLLAERFADDEAGASRFMREARAAARLSGHPNVVMIYDVGETDPGVGEGPRAFIVMEYLAGGTVADALRVDSVRRVHTVKWLHEASSALDYAHSRGVLHRDIKPANLLLDRDRTLHVGDFGIARLGTEDTITGTGQVLGTASYLAPERALGRAATEASDRYSLAVVAYELLVGERPFTSTHFAAQARQHVEDEPPAASQRNRALPPTVDAVLARGMAKRPEQRWPTAQAFAQALESALREPTTRPIRAAAAAPPPTRPIRPVAAGAVGPAAAAAADGTSPPARDDDAPGDLAPAAALAWPARVRRGRPGGGSDRRGRRGRDDRKRRRSAGALVDHRRAAIHPERDDHGKAPRGACEGRPERFDDADNADDADDADDADGDRHSGSRHNASADSRDARRAGPPADDGWQLHGRDPGTAPGRRGRLAEQPDLRLCAV